MLPLALAAGAIWAYNGVKFLQLRNRNNHLKHRDSDDTEKNITVFHNCDFHYEDKRTYNYYNNCTFNIYITGGRNER
ncbi:MAG: hypothetical protein V1762_02360 [Nitrospirota bacterium]